jgi:hypothetical protein
MAFSDILKNKKTNTGFGSILGGGTTTKNLSGTSDLETVSGLKQVAKNSGLKEEANLALQEKGEKPKEIYSGGVIMDIFDTLNALQYGVTGLLKGKSFSEGVKTRQSFSDKDALGDKGLPGTIGGIALDIAVDPLTYIPYFGWGKAALKGISGVAKATGKAITKTSLIGKTSEKIGNTLGRAFIYRFGQDPLYKEIAERSIKNINTGIGNVLELARPLTKLDSNTQKIITEARKTGKLEELPKELLSKSKPAFDELDRLGKEAVDVGLLKKEVYEQNVGKYISRLYRKYEVPEGIVGKIKTFFDRKPLRIDVSRFKKRTDIPEDVREAMGEILEAGYPTAKSLVQLTQAVERAKFFKEINGKWAKEITEEGFSKLPETKTLGELAGKSVPTPIFDDIQEIIRTKSPTEKILNKVVGGFKFGKVILNPATHARNIMSNFILNNFEGLNPARLDIYAKAAKQIATKGDLYQEAKLGGLGVDTFASSELKEMLRYPEVSKLGNTVKNTMNKVADLYQKEEEFAKMAQYIFQKSKGLSSEEAIKIAEKATFNYSQVTPFIRRMRESIFGYPFITFTYKVTPQVLKTAITKPTKISNIGKIKQGIENMSDIKELERERESEPDYVRDGFYVKLPIKDKEGRSAYLDLSYILPFGDMISGNFFERGIKRETGLPEGAVEAQVKKLPFPNLVRELSKNQDFYGNKIFKESGTIEQQLGDVFRHIVKTYTPPAISDQIPGGYRADGTRREGTLSRVLKTEKGIESGGSQTRNLTEELLRQVGIKTSPVDIELQEKFMESEKKKALETLLGEEGITAQFKKTFIPKNEK